MVSAMKVKCRMLTKLQLEALIQSDTGEVRLAYGRDMWSEPELMV